MLSMFIGFDAIKIQLSIGADKSAIETRWHCVAASATSSKRDDELALRGNIAGTDASYVLRRIAVMCRKSPKLASYFHAELLLVAALVTHTELSLAKLS